MNCPVCNVKRYSRQWKPSQWKASTAVTDRFNCCKSCSAYGVFATIEGLEKAFAELSCMRSNVAQIFPSRASFNAFIEDWMANNSAVRRKHLSHYGCLSYDVSKSTIPQSSSGERVHFVVDGGFDPGNWTYMAGMKLVAHDLVSKHDWNAETVGDIFEGLLGYRHLHHDKPDRDESIIQVANWVDSYMMAVHTFVFLAQAVAWDKFLDTPVDINHWHMFCMHVQQP